MIGILILTGLGLICGSLIVVISHYTNDISQEKIEKMLPGYNCNACGYGSCKGMALNAIRDYTCLMKCKPLSKEKYNEIVKELL